MPIDKILEEWIDEEMKECSSCEAKERTGEGECWGYTEATNQILTDLKSHIPQIKKKIENRIMLKIEEDLSNRKFYSIYSNKTTFKNYIINTLKGGNK